MFCYHQVTKCHFLFHIQSIYIIFSLILSHWQHNMYISAADTQACIHTYLYVYVHLYVSSAHRQPSSQWEALALLQQGQLHSLALKPKATYAYHHIHIYIHTYSYIKSIYICLCTCLYACIYVCVCVCCAKKNFFWQPSPRAAHSTSQKMPHFLRQISKLHTHSYIVHVSVCMYMCSTGFE